MPDKNDIVMSVHEVEHESVYMSLSSSDSVIPRSTCLFLLSGA